MNRQIVFTEINKAELLDTKMVSPLANQVKVKTIFSTISNGTEKANITGDTTVSLHSIPGEPAVFPRFSGYSSSGIVVEKGEDVKGLEIGEKICYTIINPNALKSGD